MGDRLGSVTHALVLWDERFSADNLAPNGGGALESDYSQEGPQPGEPVSMGLAQIFARGVLEQPLSVEVQQAGMIDRARVRVLDPTDDVALSHQYHGHPRAYELLQEGTASTPCTALGAAARLEDGYPVVIYGGDGYSLRARRWLGTAWSAAATIVGGLPSEGAAIVALPGRLVVWNYAGNSSRAHTSTDAGASWDVWSYDPIEEQPATLRRLTAAYGGGGIVMICQPDDLSGDLYQLVSTDLGVSFQTVVNASAHGRFVTAFPLANGDVGICYMRHSDGDPVFIRLGSAAQDITTAEEILVSGRSGFNGMTGYCDIDGRIYIALSDEGQWQTVVSDDYGLTWDELGQGLATRNTAITPQNMVGVATAFGAMVLHNSSAPVASDYDDSAHVLWLGGWSNFVFDEEAQIFGDVTQGTLWLPWAQPIGGPWSAAGAGTVTLSTGLALANQYHYTTTDVLTGNHSVFLDFQVDSGGDLTSMQVGLQMTMASGRTIQLRASTTGVRIRDVTAGTNLGTITIDMTERCQFFITLSTSGVTVYYRRPYDRRWITGLALTAVSGSGTANTIQWGNIGAGVNESTWWSLGHYTAAISDISRQGKGLPAWVPPEIWGNGAILDMAGGPLGFEDTATVQPDYAYPLAAALPTTSPSPAVRWRSTQNATAEALTWDLGQESAVGAAVALVVVGAESRRWRLETSTGGAWTTRATLDLAVGFTGLTFTRAGDTVTPNGGASAGRYIQAGELVGGWVEFAGSARRIVANTAGSWASGASIVPRIRIEIIGGEPASGTCALVAPGGLVIAQPSTVAAVRYWRVTALADETPTDRLGAGVILVGRVLGLGAQPDWGWSDDLTPAVARSRSAYGTARTRVLGPPRTRWGWSWGDGLLLEQLRQSIDQDFYGGAGGAPLVAVEDVWWQLRGALQTHQGLPVVALRRMPADGVSITDPTLWLYGDLSGSVAARGQMGEEGLDETIRLETLTIEGQS